VSPPLAWRSGVRESGLTPKLLTEWLRRSDTLRSGGIADIRIDQEFKTSISTLTFLTATYTPDVPTDLPSRLVVKSPLVPISEPNDHVGEARFYRRLAPTLAGAPLVRCLAALDERDPDGETLVLEDLRDTHDHPPWPLPPSRRQCELALDALARIHSRWWESPTLGKTVGQLHTTESLTSMVGGIAAHLPAFIDALGDALTVEGRRVYERVFSSSLEPWLRLTDARALTVAHGDAHSWNFLFPRSGEGPAFLIDWQLWHLDVGARDLAFMMALHWYPSRRRELEQPLLEHYHRRLLSHGITSYAFDDLWLDYRRCVVRNLTIPIIFWRRGMQPEGWWHRLECALRAYDDLGCVELT
jgi:hypothetical protein